MYWKFGMHAAMPMDQLLFQASISMSDVQHMHELQVVEGMGTKAASMCCWMGVAGRRPDALDALSVVHMRARVHTGQGAHPTHPPSCAVPPQ